MEGDEEVAASVVFFIFLTLISVVALNALIAFMSESFNRVNEKKKAERIRQRAGLLIELLELETLDPEERREKENGRAWIHCLAPTTALEVIGTDCDRMLDDLQSIQQKQQQAQDELKQLMMSQSETFEKVITEKLKSLENELAKEKREGHQN